MNMYYIRCVSIFCIESNLIFHFLYFIFTKKIHLMWIFNIEFWLSFATINVYLSDDSNLKCPFQVHVHSKYICKCSARSQPTKFHLNQIRYICVYMSGINKQGVLLIKKTWFIWLIYSFWECITPFKNTSMPWK